MEDCTLSCCMGCCDGDPFSSDNTSITSSQKANAGMPSRRIPASRAIISASVDEWDTAVCFFTEPAYRGIGARAY